MPYDPDQADVAKIRQLVTDLAERGAEEGAEDRSTPWIAEQLAQKLKFADCVPEPIALDIAAARVSDPTGIARIMSEPIDQA